MPKIIWNTYLKIINFCNFYPTIFVDKIQDWKQGQDEPSYPTFNQRHGNYFQILCAPALKIQPERPVKPGHLAVPLKAHVRFENKLIDLIKNANQETQDFTCVQAGVRQKESNYE